MSWWRRNFLTLIMASGHNLSKANAPVRNDPPPAKEIGSGKCEGCQNVPFDTGQLISSGGLRARVEGRVFIKFDILGPGFKLQFSLATPLARNSHF